MTTNKQITTAKERREALARTEAEIISARDRRLAELARAQADARADADRKIAEAKAVDERRSAEIDAEIASEIRKRVYPLAAEFADSPRTTAKKIGDVWKALDARASSELDARLAGGHLAIAFLVANGLAEKAGFRDVTPFGQTFAAEHAFLRLAVADAPAPALEEALRHLEARATTEAMSFRNSDPGLVAVRQAHATPAPLARAIDRYLTESRAARSASPEEKAAAKDLEETVSRNRNVPGARKPEPMTTDRTKDYFRQFE